MKLRKSKLVALTILGVSTSLSVLASDKEELSELQDMSDPLAVYSMAGLGYTDRGFNFKFGQSYDSGNAEIMAMNVIEVKGFLGESLGFSQTVEPDNSVDFIRFRNFIVNTSNGRGKQIDLNIDVERENLNLSYSFIQALPKWGAIQLYPLAGVGVSIQNNAIDRIEDDEPVIDNGYSMEGFYTVVGMYTKIELTDEIWLNYNPMYISTLSGSDHYKDNAYGVSNSNMLLHEVSASYQVNQRANIRYFANFSDEVNFKDGEHRIEVNYQF